MNVKLINAEDVKIGMYIEGRLGWWEIADIVEGSTFLVARGDDHTRLNKAIYPGSKVAAGIPKWMEDLL